MVIPAKIFEVVGGGDIDSFYDALQGFQEVEAYESPDGSGELFTEVLDLEIVDGILRGILSKDFLRERFYRRRTIMTPTTEEAHFWFTMREGRLYVIVSAPSVARGVKKLLTGHVARKLSQVIYDESDQILEVEIPDETLRQLHESNPKATNLIWFDNVRIPDVDKLCLSGSGLADTELYERYIEYGRIWYVVFTVQDKEIVIGVTRNSVIALFSKSTNEEFIEYIIENVLNLYSS